MLWSVAGQAVECTAVETLFHCGKLSPAGAICLSQTFSDHLGRTSVQLKNDCDLCEDDRQLDGDESLLMIPFIPDVTSTAIVLKGLNLE